MDGTRLQRCTELFEEALVALILDVVDRLAIVAGTRRGSSSLASVLPREGWRSTISVHYWGFHIVEGTAPPTSGVAVKSARSPDIDGEEAVALRFVSTVATNR